MQLKAKSCTLKIHISQKNISLTEESQLSMISRQDHKTAITHTMCILAYTIKVLQLYHFNRNILVTITRLKYIYPTEVLESFIHRNENVSTVQSPADVTASLITVMI